MKKKENYFKRNFATFIASYDEESFKVHRSRKEELFNEVKGTVLEIGPGTGVNFPFLQEKPITWSGVEPNTAMHPYLFDTAKENGIAANLLDCTTESICLPDNSVDFVISTEVLCSVSDLEKSISEIKRVIKPKGKFLFLEHVADKRSFSRRAVQSIVPYTPWKYFSDGCHPCRDIGTAITYAGFDKVNYTEYMREGKGIIVTINRPHICGWAIK